MARIIVTTEERERSDACVMRADQPRPDQIIREAQLTERLAWTVIDAQPRSVGWRAADRRGHPPAAGV
jgi:hypothetical protein